MRETKVIVIGLDGITFDLIDPWIKEGKLPNMAEIREKGVRSNLISTFPPVTAPAMASFQTGKNPGKHGIMDFGVHHGHSSDVTPINASYVDGKSLWSILSEAGKKVIVLHVPLTFPPEKVNGFMVSGILSPQQSTFTYPSSLKRELLKEIDDYRSTMKVYPGIKGTEDAFLRDLHYTTEKIVEETLYMMKRYKWNFFMTYFQWGDALQHHFWKYMDSQHPAYNSRGAEKYGDAILRYYQKLDAAIGKILENIDKNTITIIMSDHGFGPLHKRVLINQWLRKNCLLKFRKRSRKNILHRVGLTQDIVDFWFMEKLGLITILLMKVLPRVIVENIYKSIPVSRFDLSDVDWSKTKAYSLGGVGQIFINLKGREPKGIVEPGKEYEELRDFIIKKLYELKDPSTGERIVDEVLKGEEVYYGPHTHADLLFVMKGMSYMSHSFRATGEFQQGSIVVPPYRGISGWHRMNGVLLVKGPQVKRGVRIKDSRIIDLAPTILHIMGVPIPSDMDGRVLKEIFEDGSDLKGKVRYQMTIKENRRRKYSLSREEEEEIRRRLRELGYL